MANENNNQGYTKILKIDIRPKDLFNHCNHNTNLKWMTIITPLIDAQYEFKKDIQDYNAKAKDIMTKQEIGGTLAILSLLEELKDRQSQSILTMKIAIK